MGSFFALLWLTMGWQVDPLEISTLENGMIYSDAVMAKLQAAMTQENRKTSPRLPTETFRSFPYRIADALVLEGPGEEIGRIFEDIMAANSAEDASLLAPDDMARVVNDLPIIFIGMKGEDPGWLDLIGRQKVEVQPDGHKGVSFPGNCRECYGKERVRFSIYFFTQPSKRMDLGAKYGRMMVGAAAMLGNEPIFQMPQRRLNQPQPETTALDALKAFLEYEPCPVIPVGQPTREMRVAYRDAVDEWCQKRRRWIHEIKAHDPEFIPLLRSAVGEAFELGFVSLEFEDLAARYLEKTKALELMRLANVKSCTGLGIGAAVRPARVAKLAGEIGDVPLFLRAHLSIIEHRGNGLELDAEPGQEKRTYFRELEALGLDKPEWLAGLSLLVPPITSNRFLMNPFLLGKSWVEASDPDALLLAMMAMVCDPELDPPNRLILSYAVAGYLSQLEAEVVEDYLTQFRSEFENLPGFFVELVRLGPSLRH